jgi:diguanylate cyclase (GGDEF)-like protein
MAAHAIRLWRMIACFLVLFCAGLSAPATAQEGALFEQKLQACVKPVEAGDDPAVLAKTPHAFNCTKKQSALPSGDYWVRLDAGGIVGNTADPIKLRVISVWQGEHDVHSYYADGSAYRLTVGPDRTSRYLYLGGLIEFPLQNQTTPLETIVVKVPEAANVRGIMLAPKLVSTSKSARDERNNAAYYGLFAGLCIALLVYNMALWRGMRSPFQLAYGAMVVSLLAYAFTSSGAAAYAFPDIHNTDRLRINYVLLSLAAATALIFLRHFLEDHILPRWLVIAAWVQSFVLITTASTFALLAPQSIKFLDFIYFVSFMPLPAFFFVSVYYGWRKNSRYIGYIIVAWSAPVAVALARTLHGFGVIPYNFLLDNGSLMAMAFEAMISSMAIGQRIRGITRDRDLAIAAERVANDLADKDALTGLLNRRAFVREMLAEPRDWQLVIVDIDHFKRVNDTLGHDGGDDVLVRLAETLRANCPETSLVARLGGEEFAIATLAPFDGSGLVQPEALLKAVRRAKMPKGYRITASIGIARRVICEEQDWKVLYRAADMALYRAKAEGRDRHVDYSADRVAA